MIEQPAPQQPRAVIAVSRIEFHEICERHGWNPHQIHYVDIRQADEYGLSGFYAEDVYPPEYGNKFCPARH